MKNSRLIQLKCLKNTYSSFKHQLYKHIEGAHMGSALAPVITNLSMIYMEKKAFNDSNLRPTI